jgi:hypothetical protein
MFSAGLCGLQLIAPCVLPDPYKSNQNGCVWRDCGRTLATGKQHCGAAKVVGNSGENVADQQNQTKLQVGDVAPELIYLARDGGERKLSNVWQYGPALVLWLRHLG